VFLFVWCRLLDEQQSQEPVENDEILCDLRAALDVERCRVMELTAELEQFQEQSSGGVWSNGNVAELQEKVDQLTVTFSSTS
jgi:hypothetical protein